MGHRISVLEQRMDEQDLLTGAQAEELEIICEENSKKKPLVFQGHQYQIFQDLSPITLANQKAMKPHLQILQQHRITYRWHFPFAIRFSYQGSSYQYKSTDDFQVTLQNLHLLPNEPVAEGSRRRAASNFPKKILTSTGLQATSNTNK